MEIERPKNPLEMIFALGEAVRKMGGAKNCIEFQDLMWDYESMKHLAYSVLPLGTVSKTLWMFDNRAIDAANKYLIRMLN